MDFRLVRRTFVELLVPAAPLPDTGRATEPIAAKRGRATRPGLKLGICGEHGGDPASISFCQVVGLDYVSCSPYRVPIARLAAAQAVLSGESESGTA